MDIRTRSNVFSRRVVVLGLSALALLGVGVGACTAASASPAHPAGHAKQHRTLPRGYHYRSIRNPDCGKDQRAIIVWADKGDTSVMICHDGKSPELS
jgi:hypothetical protein